jgi:hypothetical protein
MIDCNENAIYIFLEIELRGLRPYFHIHVSVRDLYIYLYYIYISHDGSPYSAEEKYVDRSWEYLNSPSARHLPHTR